MNEFGEACHIAQRMTWSEDELNAYDDAFVRETDKELMVKAARNEGPTEGREQSKYKIAKALLARGIDNETIASVTGLSLDYINTLKKVHNDE
jgi:predicted transposase/invertase (TIGR01784 family)